MSHLARICSVAALAALTAGAAAQSTLVVPTSFATIQAAIGAAGPGDTVLVLPGVYVERIDFLGKAITVRSAAGAAVTSIDGSQGGSVVTFASNETPAAVLVGFTLTNGRGASVAMGTPPRAAAGGITCFGASPTIRACRISGNRGGDGVSAGGAVQLAGAGGPGGVLAIASGMRLLDCAILGNVGGAGGAAGAGSFGGAAGGRGGAGGAYFGFTSGAFAPELRGCRFEANLGGDGGGLLPTVTSGNGGRGGDGAFEMFATVAVGLAHCELRGNFGGNGPDVAGNDGSGGHGGFDLSAPSALAVVPVQFLNCVIVGNVGGDALGTTSASGGNGGGATGAARVTVIATTIAGNATGLPQLLGTGVGGLAVGGFMISTATLRNCIVWGNTRLFAPSDFHSNGIATQAGSSNLGATTGTVVGSGNLSVDPLFANLAGGDVHLTEASPCRHAGSAMPELPRFDLDGDPRTVGPAPDMGADEWDTLVGSREDLTLALTVGGAAPPAVTPVTAAANTTVAIDVRSPGGSLAGTFAMVGFEPWLPPNAPSGPAALPELHLSPAAVLLTTLPGGVGAAGTSFAATIPPGLGGLALRLQAFALTPLARNGAFAATSARDVVF